MKSFTEPKNFKPKCPDFRTRYCYDLCNWFEVCQDFTDEYQAFLEEEKPMKEIDVGTTVMLCTAHLKDIPKELKDMDQRVFKVKKVTIVSQQYRYYELYGCKSKMGVPFCIDEDWIVPVKGLKR